MTSARRLLTALAIAATVAWCGPVSAADMPSPPAGLTAPAKPTTLPAFDLPTTAGTQLRSETLKGQVLVIRFWASW